MTNAKTLVARLRADAGALRAIWPKAAQGWADDMSEAADAIEELTAMLRLVTIDGGGPRFEGLAHATAARALLTKYGASNG